MAAWLPPRFGAAFAGLLLWGGLAQAAPPATTLRDFPGISATMDIAGDLCPATVPVTIRSSAGDTLRRDSKVLARVMGWAQITVDTTCPNATAIEVTGRAGDEIVYRGLARRADQWTLVEIASPVPAAVAIASAPDSVAPVAAAPVPPIGKETSMAAAAIRQCDKLAAHPDDPEAFASGVSDAKLDAKAAIPACEAAIKAEPQTPRLRFQLARAYFKAERVEDAIEQLIAAAEQGHGGALGYLADLHVGGAPGIEADPGLAKALYEKAVASGFTPAAAILKEFEDKTDAYEESERAEQQDPVFTAKPYMRPKIIEALLKNDLDGVDTSESWTKKYLYNIAESIESVCGKPFTKRQLAELKTASEVPTFSYSEQYRASVNMAYAIAVATDTLRNLGRAIGEADNTPDIDYEQILFEQSMNDASSFMTRNLCGSPVLESFARTITKYINSDGAAPSPPDALLRQCANNAKPAGKPVNEFCLCYAGAMDQIPISRYWRRQLLSPDFWPASQEHFKHSPATFRPCL